MTDRFKVIAASHVFLIKDGKIFLNRRSNTGFLDGHYSVPGGHYEEGESALKAAIREAQEEAGVTIRPENLSLAHVDDRKATDQYIDFYFSASEWQGEPYNAEPQKSDIGGWFDIQNLPAPMSPYIQSAIDHFIKGKYYSEFGW